MLSRRVLLAGLGACAVVGAGTATRLGRGASEGSPRMSPVYAPLAQTSELRRLQPDALLDISTDQPLVALTFDDGPDPRYTPQVLDILGDFGATATFFLVGANARAYPSLVRRILTEGHSVGNHTFAHVDLVRCRPAEILDEIDRGTEVITTIAGVRPSWFRPPLASTNQAVGVLSDARHYTTVYWTTCLEKYADVGAPTDATQWVVNDVHDGSIILAHDGGTIVGSAAAPLDRSRTIAALPLLLSGLAHRGLQAVGVPSLVGAAR